jgi:hypothetical protein
VKLLILLLLPLTAFADLTDNQFLSYKEAADLWNTEPFTPAKFKAAKPEDRGGFALDLLNHDIFTSKKLSEVRKALGDPDGNYKARNVLAYRLGSDDKNAYQLVFLPDYQGKSVENIKIYHEPTDEVRPTSISMGSKRLPITIEGALAESIFKHLRMSETKGIKTGKNIACNLNAGHYRCSLELDDQGAAFAK